MYEATPLPFDEKTCSKCLRELPREAFNKRTRSADGLQAWCRECERSQHAQRYQLNPVAILERNKRWSEANPERRREANRRQYAGNPERRRESSQRWRQRNPDKVRAAFAAWREENTDYDRARNKAYRLENPEVNREAARRRRVRKAGNGQVEAFTRQEIGGRDGWICGICGTPIDRDLLWPDPQSQSLDHIIAVSRGGEHARSNCRIAHLGCNVRRGNRSAA